MLRLNNLAGFGGVGENVVALTGNDSFTKVLFHMEGSNGGTTFTDSNAGGVAKTWTPSLATTSTGDKKFGATSLLAAGGSVSTPDHADFTLGSGDWTVDFWINRAGNYNTRGIFGQANSNLTSVSIGAGWNVSDKISVYANNAFLFQTTTAIADANWHHIAIVKSGSGAGAVKVYFDGVADATTGTLTSVPDLSSSWYVGRVGDFASTNFTGYIDEFRLSVGIARWTANFTPPASAYGP